MTETYLLATDLSASSTASEEYAAEFLDPDKASVHLLTVIDLFDEGKIREFSTSFSVEELQKRHQKQALEELKPRAETLENKGFTTEYEAIHGRPGHTICQRAEELDASGIFVGRGLHGRLGEMFQGSMSYYVVRHSTIPVLVTPSKPAE